MTHNARIEARIPESLLDRLTRLAERTDRSREECLIQAIGEFCDTWEDYHRTVDQLVREDDRRFLRVVND